ncbi:NAC domain [Arabidopsis suecica]|uniref:NAC domain n=1 Tax=Arabidopsis suecica TaxID=45249 RepID=A0A8T1XR89_ARASU|nr:NAC domain [Arabidopsis suecica]
MSNGYDSEEDGGFHFDPSDQEIIDYLMWKERGEPCGNFIVEKDVYAKEPWLLDHTNDPFFNENEWYYFGIRTQISERKISCGKNVKRKIMGDHNDGIDRGYWRLNGNTNIIDEKTGMIIGVNQSLTFHKGNNDNNTKKQKRGDGSSANVTGSESRWIMNEFVLPSKADTFQKLVVCKIKKKNNPTKKDDDHHHEAAFSLKKKNGRNGRTKRCYGKLPNKGLCWNRFSST